MELGRAEIRIVAYFDRQVHSHAFGIDKGFLRFRAVFQRAGRAIAEQVLQTVPYSAPRLGWQLRESVQRRLWR